jgi:hypothetical protein
MCSTGTCAAQPDGMIPHTVPDTVTNQVERAVIQPQQLQIFHKIFHVVISSSQFFRLSLLLVGVQTTPPQRCTDFSGFLSCPLSAAEEHIKSYSSFAKAHSQPHLRAEQRLQLLIYSWSGAGSNGAKVVIGQDCVSKATSKSIID